MTRKWEPWRRCVRRESQKEKEGRERRRIKGVEKENNPVRR
jgi:hypothetical protein